MEEIDDEFLDAEESFEETQNDSDDNISLTVGIRETSKAIDKFFNNDFEGARNHTEKYRHISIYHAMGHGVFNFLRAVLTLEQEHVVTANRELSESLETIQTFRKKGGLVDLVKSKDFDSLTETEVHAELVYAECLLLKAMLTICEDETLGSFFNAGWKVKQAFSGYRECWSILKKRNWSKDKEKEHFEGGVRLGYGTFNLLMSIMPPKITKIIEFIGLTNSKDVGMKELMACYHSQDNIRQVLSALVLLMYNLFLKVLMGKPCDKELVQEILDDKLTKYPNGAFYLFFKGRFEMISGRFESATSWYVKAMNCQKDWIGFQHVGCWELLWIAWFRCEWRESLVYADRLVKESKWSPCMYSYFKAAIYSQLTNLTLEEKEEQLDLMKRVPKLKQKISGKSIPSEKFAIKKAEKFSAQNNYLLLPLIELIYLWGGFTTLSQNQSCLQNIHAIVQEAQNKQTNCNAEDSCLLNLLEGACLKYLGCPLQAEEKFQLVLSKSNEVKNDKYLIPYTMVELATLYIELKELPRSKEMLSKAKAMTGYLMQNRLHLKIHANFNKIKTLEGLDSVEENNVVEPTDEFHDAED